VHMPGQPVHRSSERQKTSYIVAIQPDDTLGDPFGVVLGPYFWPRFVAIGIAGQTIVATPSPRRV